MRFLFRIAPCLFLFVATALAASKAHVVAFGKWAVVRVSTGLDQSRSEELKVRPMYVDGRLKEFTVGIPHDVTEELFVVRRMVRV